MLKGPKYNHDIYAPIAKLKEVAFGDGTADATTDILVITVDGKNPYKVAAEVDVKTAFNGSTPTGAVLALDDAGSILATIMSVNACAVTTAADGRTGVARLTESADIVFRYARPASGNTTGLAQVVVTAYTQPGTDDV